MIQTIAKRVHTVAQMIVKRIKQVTRSANSSLVGDLIIERLSFFSLPM